MSKELGKRINEALKKQGMSQKELAQTINTTEASLSRYINGDRDPKAEVLANIATALHTTSDYLLGIENEEYDFPKLERLIARGSSNMTDLEKKKLINALFGEN